MEKLDILFDKENPRDIDEQVVIEAISEEKGLDYKFIVGNDGIWSTIQEYSSNEKCAWQAKESGKYIIMVQGREKDSNKPFKYVAKKELVVGDETENKLIKDVILNDGELTIGDKLRVNVITAESPLLYRFWIKAKQDWVLIRDYTTESLLSYTVNKPGKQEILIECKHPESGENFDDYTTIRFDVSMPVKTEIKDFKCLTEELLINEELVFKVEASLSNKRNLLYKFIRIDDDGKAICIQDFSSRRTVAYQEKQPGQYRLLCLVRDILSGEEYDDRAIIVYNVKPYNEVKINKFVPDIVSPQVNGTSINVKAEVEGGRELLYRYVVDGPIAEDSGYIRGNEYLWEAKSEGEYQIHLFVKDISYDGEYEDKRTIVYSIDKKADKPVKIKDVVIDNEKIALIGKPTNIKVCAEGGISLEYSFLVYKDRKEQERIEYGKSNWVNFIPEEKGEYEIEIRVRDKYSSKEYDSNTFVYLKVRDYLPADIDYILLPHKNTYLVNDTIEVEAIVQNTKKVLMRYVTKINGHVVEDTDFIVSKKLAIKPKCSGKYTFEIYAKNEKCQGEFDTKKEMSIYVSEATPVTKTKIDVDPSSVKINNEVTFRVSSVGGKEVCYEFYIMENGNWTKVQNYSRKDYYTFIPFLRGEYRVMVMAKSFYKKVNYEDYDEVKFVVS